MSKALKRFDKLYNTANEHDGFENEYNAIKKKDMNYMIDWSDEIRVSVSGTDGITVKISKKEAYELVEKKGLFVIYYQDNCMTARVYGTTRGAVLVIG